jgi:hypothetical protein
MVPKVEIWARTVGGAFESLAGFRKKKTFGCAERAEGESEISESEAKITGYAKRYFVASISPTNNRARVTCNSRVGIRVSASSPSVVRAMFTSDGRGGGVAGCRWESR